MRNFSSEREKQSGREKNRGMWKTRTGERGNNNLRIEKPKVDLKQKGKVCRQAARLGGRDVSKCVQKKVRIISRGSTAKRRKGGHPIDELRKKRKQPLPESEGGGGGDRRDSFQGLLGVEGAKSCRWGGANGESIEKP